VNVVGFLCNLGRWLRACCRNKKGSVFDVGEKGKKKNAVFPPVWGSQPVRIIKLDKTLRTDKIFLLERTNTEMRSSECARRLEGAEQEHGSKDNGDERKQLKTT